MTLKQFSRKGGSQTSAAKKRACKANALKRWAKVRAERRKKAR